MKRLLTLAVICLVLGVNTLQAQFTIRGGCLPDDFELIESGTRNGRPNYLRQTGPGEGYSLGWDPTSGGAWVVRRNGVPIGVNRNDTPLPPLSSESPYEGFNQCAGNPPQVVSTQALPVEWVSFSGHVAPTGILLNWSTVDERDNLGFHVQRLDGKDWRNLGFVPAITDGEVSVFEYEFLDDTVGAGQHHYRLAQEDLDGTISHSKLITVEFTSGSLSLTAYPNPTRSTLQLRSVTAAGATVEVIDGFGRTVAAARPYLPGSKIDLTALPGATYYLIYRTGGKTQTIRILKSK